MTSQKFPTLYIPHGGGPCFFMEWNPADTWNRMGDWLRQLGASIGPAPKAILVISAHWEEADFKVTSGSNPELIYDYYGFPEHTYRLTYPAPGSPALAKRVQTLLQGAGMHASQDARRGFDHGVFIPFKLIYPEANIPVVQLSLCSGLDPAAHIRAGQALQPLREEGVLIVGSGMSYHNMRGIGAGPGGASDQFDAWLGEAVAAAPALRDEKLAAWSQAPGARIAHPREEHLLPLMVVAGAAGRDRGRRIFSDRILGGMISGFRFS
ncbi:DODA-type extradiol aromatic ring-opening family dioxygenase [Nevskia soli]|uniref:DODA-type extradiol aromatic ring-opening family dioxygenase n=1 Tax=Nevskia soli TaxID=418856 RepID=UPI0004A6B3F4|nr:class III extradiol ring-cleavage dioxygenase [Nevskia soli]